MQHTSTVTIEEMNATIALFDGAKMRPHVTGYAGTYLYKDGKRWIQPGMLKYHSDWNMLMGVCVKCENFWNDVSWGERRENGIFHAIRSGAMTFNLAATHLAVYQFAKWYLSQEQSAK